MGAILRSLPFSDSLELRLLLFALHRRRHRVDVESVVGLVVVLAVVSVVARKLRVLASAARVPGAVSVLAVLPPQFRVRICVQEPQAADEATHALLTSTVVLISRQIGDSGGAFGPVSQSLDQVGGWLLRQGMQNRIQMPLIVIVIQVVPERLGSQNLLGFGLLLLLVSPSSPALLLFVSGSLESGKTPHLLHHIFKVFVRFFFSVSRVFLSHISPINFSS